MLTNLTTLPDMETIYRKTETNILGQFQRQHSNISLENQSAVPRNAYTLEPNKQRCCIDENANFIEDSFQHQNQYLLSKTETFLSEQDTSDDNFTSEDSNSDLAIDSEEASVNSLSDGSLDPSEDSEYLQVSSDFDACECCEFHAHEDTDLFSSASQLHCCANVSPPTFKSASLREIDMSSDKTHNVEQLLAERISLEKTVSSETREPAIVNRIQKAQEARREELVMRSELSCSFQRVGHTEARASQPAYPEATPLKTIRTSRALESLKIIDWDHLIRYTPNIYAPTLLMIPVEKETQHDTFDISLPFSPEN